MRMLPRSTSARVSLPSSRCGGSPLRSAFHLSHLRRYASALINAERYPATLPMRVDTPRFAWERLGFSPQAILSPYLAPGNFIDCTVRPGTTFRTTLRPPMRLADPGSTWSVVTPPASTRGNCGSCGQTECSAHTCGVEGLVASFPSLSAFPPGAA